MKRIRPSNLVLVLLIGAGFLYYLYSKGYIFANFTNLDPEQAYHILEMEKNAIILVDVRTPEEVETDGRISGSILIPLDELPNRIDKLSRDKKIFVYCRSGMRSASASRFLSSLGYKVYNIKGGIEGWKAEGLPIEKPTSF